MCPVKIFFVCLFFNVKETPPFQDGVGQKSIFFSKSFFRITLKQSHVFSRPSTHLGAGGHIPFLSPVEQTLELEVVIGK